MREKFTLNKRLIHVPQECIDYVSAHELAHFLEPNHSANFYRVLDNVRPSWRMEREKLAQYTCPKIKKTVHMVCTVFFTLALFRAKACSEAKL